MELPVPDQTMYPQGYPTEAVPLQGVRHYGFPGQPGAVQHTSVNISTERPVVAESSPDHIIWSLCCFVYSNPFCLGLAALIYSIKSRDRKLVGDLDGARRYGSTARWLNIAATIIFVTGLLIFIITVTAVTVQATSYYYNGYRSGY
ncbi:dispanin subfamily A member 2b-like [Archocentrus centrarchus]|uniref:dispanin subfamily A member 2b-like n=1 Tax=Archocentrus centrarchus TaxID=63155 RepID=UPI0011E9F032|nr:dispanin subfamily A member 2b-like [Archocentrus centrarchus]